MNQPTVPTPTFPTMSPPPRPADEALAEAYRETGDPELLGELYSRYLELVYGLCLHYLRDGGRAEDAAMDVYEALVTKLREHRVEHFRPWLYRLARNHCLMILRRRSTSRLTRTSTSVDTVATHDVSDMHWADLAHQGGVTDVDHRADEEHRLEALAACTEALAEGQAHCIRRFYLEGASYVEIAEELSWTFNKVRSAIQNGRRNLKRCVERKTHHVER